MMEYGLGGAGVLMLLLFGIFVIVYYNDYDTYVTEFPNSNGIPTVCASDNLATQTTLSNVSLADSAKTVTTDHSVFGMDWVPNQTTTPPADGSGDGSTPPVTDATLGTATYYTYSNHGTKMQTGEKCADMMIKKSSRSDASKTISFVRVPKYQQWIVAAMLFSLLAACFLIGISIGIYTAKKVTETSIGFAKELGGPVAEEQVKKIFNTTS